MAQTGSRISVAGDTMIVCGAIHPAIGIRIGNSIDAFFYGPEVNYPTPAAPGFYRDAIGALRRQAARFRIYGYNVAGVTVAELTAANASITWSVHLGNEKAAWYEFQLAMDIPEVVDQPSRPNGAISRWRVPTAPNSRLTAAPSRLVAAIPRSGLSL